MVRIRIHELIIASPIPIYIAIQMILPTLWINFQILYKYSNLTIMAILFRFHYFYNYGTSAIIGNFGNLVGISLMLHKSI